MANAMMMVNAFDDAGIKCLRLNEIVMQECNEVCGACIELDDA